MRANGGCTCDLSLEIVAARLVDAEALSRELSADLDAYKQLVRLALSHLHQAQKLEAANRRLREENRELRAQLWLRQRRAA